MSRSWSRLSLKAILGSSTLELYLVKVSSVSIIGTLICRAEGTETEAESVFKAFEIMSSICVLNLSKSFFVSFCKGFKLLLRVVPRERFSNPILIPTYVW